MFLVWASATGRLQLSYTAMIIAGFIFANSNACIDTVAVAANVANWPNDRGSAAGVMKAAVGLCPSIFGILYLSLQLTAPSYLLLCMLAPSIGCVLLLPMVNEVPWIQRCELMPHGLLTTPSRFIMTYQVCFSSPSHAKRTNPVQTIRNPIHQMSASSVHRPALATTHPTTARRHAHLRECSPTLQL